MTASSMRRQGLTFQLNFSLCNRPNVCHPSGLYLPRVKNNIINNNNKVKCIIQCVQKKYITFVTSSQVNEFAQKFQDSRVGLNPI